MWQAQTPPQHLLRYSRHPALQHTHTISSSTGPQSCLRGGVPSQGLALSLLLSVPPPTPQPEEAGGAGAVRDGVVEGKQLLGEPRAPATSLLPRRSAPGSGSTGSIPRPRQAGRAAGEPEGSPPRLSGFLRRPCGPLPVTSQRAFVQKKKQNRGSIRLWVCTQVEIF